MRYSWPKTMLSVFLILVSLVVAVYATTVATAGVSAWTMGGGERALDLLSLGTLTIVAAMATAAVFGYLAVVSARDLMRRR